MWESLGRVWIVRINGTSLMRLRFVSVECEPLLRRSETPAKNPISDFR